MSFLDLPNELIQLTSEYLNEYDKIQFRQTSTLVRDTISDTSAKLKLAVNFVKKEIWYVLYYEPLSWDDRGYNLSFVKNFYEDNKRLLCEAGISLIELSQKYKLQDKKVHFKKKIWRKRYHEFYDDNVLWIQTVVSEALEKTKLTEDFNYYTFTVPKNQISLQFALDCLMDELR